MVGLRILSFIILILSAIFTSWPVTAALAVFLAASFSVFWEMILAGFLLGAIYGFPEGGSGFLFSFFVLSFSAAFIIEEFLKRFIRERSIFSSLFVALIGAIVIALLWLIFKIILYV